MNPKFLPICAVSLFLSACSGGSTAVETSITGTYGLRTIKDSDLPVEVAYQAYITAGALTFAEGGTFRDSTSFRMILPDGSVNLIQQIEDGTYTRAGSTLDLHFANDGRTWPATLAGTQVIVHTSGPASGDYVYQR
jgi:hypothetical protein